MSFWDFTFFLFFGVVLIVGCEVRNGDELGLMVGLMESELDGTYKEIMRTQNENYILSGNPENEKNDSISKPDWDNGFWTGNLWLMFELTGDDKWKERALQFTLPLEEELWNGESSLSGLTMMASFGQAIKYSDNSDYRDVLVQSAKVLSSRFNPVIGAFGEPKTNSNVKVLSVNIESMLNIDLLFWAAQETGNENFSKIAVRHVRTVLQNHFGGDMSCNEVVDYDLKTGSIRGKYNRHVLKQSSWTLGQAVALYGVTTSYRETKRDEFLMHAEQIAGFILNQPIVTLDRIPSCDFALHNEPDLDCDFSVGVIIASALYELSGYSVHAAKYIETADKLLENISSKKFPVVSDDYSIEGSMFTRDSFDEDNTIETRWPMLLTDYYFLESLLHRRFLTH